VAELRGRSIDWADRAVRDAVSATASEAVALNVVDFVANDRAEVLARIENTEIQLNPVTTISIGALAEAPQVRTDLTAWERFLDVLADPNIAALLLSIGFLGIVVELLNPGLFVPGVAGVIALALGFLGFGVLPVDTVGLALVGIALVLLLLELAVPSGGVLGTGGIVALILGGIIAFRDTPAEFQPSRILLAVLLVLLVTIFLSVALGVLRMRKVAVAVGTAAMVGHRANVRTPMNPEGFVFVEGERWRARLRQGRAEPGEIVRIVDADGLQLVVEREETQ
jgi:membrane-bound serine protease (ClpP class)